MILKVDNFHVFIQYKGLILALTDKRNESQMARVNISGKPQNQ